MERLGLTIGRVVMAVAATAATVLLLYGTDGSAPAWITAAVVLLAIGLIVNRVWAAALPFALTVAWLAFALLAYGAEGGEDFSWEEMAMALAGFAAAISVCLLIGVGLRRLARRGDKETRAT